MKHHLSQWTQFKCSCQKYGGGYVLHTWGREIGEVYSWACLNCFQAYVVFFDVSGEYPKAIHTEKFACIGDLPECLQFSYLWFDHEGEGPYAWDDDHKWDWGDDEAVRETRRGLDLVPLDGDLYDRALGDDRPWLMDWDERPS